MKNKIKFLAALLFTLFAIAQAMAANALIPPKARFLDANGNPLAGGKVYTYEAGTTTPLATYNKAEEIVGNLNTNPVILDANGEANIWVKENNYKIVLKNSADVTQWTVDNYAYLVDGTISASKLAANSVTTAKIADSNVTTAKIADSNVTSAKILDGTIATADVADGAITGAKKAALGQQSADAGGAISTTSTSNVDATGLTVTITTTGRPVFIALTSDPGGTYSDLHGSVGANGFFSYYTILRDSTEIWKSRVGGSASVSSGSVTSIAVYVPASVFTIDTPAAGTYTYKVQYRSSGSSVQTNIDRGRLIAFEL